MQLHLLLASGEWCLFYLYEVSWIKTWIKNNFRGTSWLIITNYSPNWYSIQTLCLIGAWHVLTDANVTWSVNNIPQLLLMCTSTLKKKYLNLLNFIVYTTPTRLVKQYKFSFSQHWIVSCPTEVFHLHRTA